MILASSPQRSARERARFSDQSRSSSSSRRVRCGCFSPCSSEGVNLASLLREIVSVSVIRQIKLAVVFEQFVYRSVAS